MIEIEIKDFFLRFHTTDKVFCPKYIDKGTLALLSQIDFRPDDIVLDLGCGYGVVGILAGKIIDPENVYMIDNNPEAIKLSKINAKLNNITGINIIESEYYEYLDCKNFTMILSNPPYQADFKVPKIFIEKGFNRLRIGGKFFMVTKRRLWYKNKFISIFGGVTIKEIDGYHIFTAEKRQNKFSFALRKKKK